MDNKHEHVWSDWWGWNDYPTQNRACKTCGMLQVLNLDTDNVTEFPYGTRPTKRLCETQGH